jgi:cytochrome c553
VTYQRSIEQRRLKIIEDVCATCGGGGEDGGAEMPEYEPAVGEDDVNLSKALNKLKGKKKRKPVAEGYKKPNSEKMMGQALKYEMDADKQSNKDKKMSFIDRARKIRQEMG